MNKELYDALNAGTVVGEQFNEVVDTICTFLAGITDEGVQQLRDCIDEILKEREKCKS